MKLCSVTIAPDRKAGDAAIATVQGLTDQNLVFNPGMVITDFSVIRNRVLLEAHEAGFDWALMLDTDERIHGADRERVEHWLTTTPYDVVMVRHDSMTYEKERFFRLPARGHYVGPVHEAWITEDGASRGTMPATMMTFSEEPKTPEQLHAKLERDLMALEDYTETHPDDPRWFYYLGDTYQNLDDSWAAVSSFETCYELNGWSEESAWACWRIATIKSGERAYDETLEWCLKGMERRPDFPEFPWLCGWCEYQRGRYEKAVSWAEIAIGMNRRAPISPRIGFRYPPAHSVAPWDVLRWAYKALGNPHGEAFAEEGYQRAKGDPSG